MKKRILGLVATLMLTTGCSIHGLDEYKITNAGGDSSYNLGDHYVEDKLTDIDIKWPCGKVEIRESIGFEKPTYQFYERWGYETNEDVGDRIIHWKLENGKLTISPAASGTYKYDELEKDLYLFIPTEFSLNSLKIDTVKANIDSTIVGDNTTINSVSGSITFYSESAKEVRINNVSGDVNLSFSEFDNIVIDTVSADTVLTTKKDKELNVEVDTISGKKTLNDVVESSKGKKVELNSVSGSITINGEL